MIRLMKLCIVVCVRTNALDCAHLHIARAQASLPSSLLIHAAM